MKKLAFFISFLIISLFLSAAVVEPERAVQVAQSFVPSTTVLKKGSKKAITPESKIVYTHYMPKSGKPAIYVVNIGDAFAMVSADDVAHPVLGYNYGKSWPQDGNLPPQVKSFLDDLAAQMEAASEHPQDTITAAEWNAPRRMSRRAKTDNLPDSVGPLLTTTWDQGQYYNAMCPVDEEGPDGHCLTGCVATAMAQIVNYWGQRQPIHTRGIHSYQSNYGELRVNYDSTFYDFAHMPNQLTASSTQQEKDAVAKLMYECGVAVNMGYGTIASGASPHDTRIGLLNYYTFSSDISHVKRSYLSDEAWDNLLRDNIRKGRPIFYSGGSHAFVCDGYKSNFYYHFNFGWSGWFDGWYLSNGVSPGADDFNSKQSIQIDIYPDNNANTIFGQDGNSNYIIFDALDFQNHTGRNLQTTQMAGGVVSGTITFRPDDENQQLVLDILKYDITTDDEFLTIYDGDNQDILLRSLSLADISNIDLSPIVSTRHALTIVIYDAILDKYSSHLRISKDGPCRMVSNVSTTIDSNLVNVEWIPHGTDTSWIIEYGEVGFDSANSSTILVDTNSISLPIELDKEYELRIRPLCNSTDNYLAFTHIIQPRKKYWTDIVNSQPDGYVMSTDGTIHITTAEGLAWIAKLRNQMPDGYRYSFHDISLENDIDLGDYLWTPIFEWNGNFDGNGHVISNMKIYEPGYEPGGFFNFFKGDTLKDIGFENSKIEAYHVATIAVYLGALYTPSVAINCYSKNFSIAARSNSGGSGLFGIDGTSKVLNSFSVGKFYDGYNLGGIATGGYLRNCYSSIESMDTYGWRGLIAHGTGNGTFINCYANIDYVPDTWSSEHIGYLYDADNAELGYFFGYYSDVKKIQNMAGFTCQGGTYAHTIPEIAVNYKFDNSIDLVTALNQDVIEMNSPALREWIWDSISRMPIFGDYHVVTCPNVSNITAKNIALNGDYAVALSWIENGSAEEWRIKCLPAGVNDEDSAVYFSSMATADTIYGLTLGKNYDIYIHPVCDDSNSIVWGEPLTFYVDKAYWNDIVTSCPEGYIEDINGNIIISTAEGLAWLSVCSNGQNGQNIQRYEGKTIEIVADIDMDAYKWTPISQFLNNSKSIQFMGTLDGNNHIISHIYCNEKDNIGFCSSYLGLIGNAVKSSIRNLSISNSIFIGSDRIGTVVGELCGSSLDNIHVRDIIIKGRSFAGGLVGYMMAHLDNNVYHESKITNSSSSGDIYGDESIGGLAGLGGNIYNCFSKMRIMKSNAIIPDNKGGLIGSCGNISNCYTTGRVEEIDWRYTIGRAIGWLYSDANISNLYALSNNNQPLLGTSPLEAPHVRSNAFFKKDGILESPITIQNTTYLTLLSSLNAWVDENNTEGNFFHWKADSTNINDGYPLLTLEPVEKKSVIIFQDEHGTILQSDTVYNGAKPIFRGIIPSKESTPEYSYSFKGWAPEVVMTDGDAVFTPIFDSVVNQYTITFINFDGTVLQSIKLDYGTMPAYYGDTPQKPTTEQYRYSFRGWNPDIVIVSGGAIYTAVYDSLFIDPNCKHWIEFRNEDGEELCKQQWFCGFTPYCEIVQSWEDDDYLYTFNKWEPEVEPVTCNATYTAIYTVTPIDSVFYTIHFIDWDGHELQTIQEQRGNVPNYTGAIPERTSEDEGWYVFRDWYPEIEEAISDATYTAEYMKMYYVTFENWDGEELYFDEWEEGTIPAYDGETPTKPASAQYTYIFKGWVPEIGGVSGNDVYTATYDCIINQYTITFNNYDGTELQSGKLDYGAMPKYDGTTPQKLATTQYTYTFKGWKPEVVAVTGDAVYTAEFDSVVNQYTITFINYDGTELQSGKLDYGAMPAYNGATPQKLATTQYTYNFKGWKPEVVAVTGDAIYTADFDSIVNKYLITFNNYDGTQLQSDSVAYGEVPAYTGTEPQRLATTQYTYKFKGWKPEVVAVTGDAIYTADFDSVVNQYTITFNNYDGTELQSGKLDYGVMPAYTGTEPQRLATTQYTYKFIGWKPEVVAVTGNAVYTAEFDSIVNKYTITFLDEDGTVLSSEQWNYGVTPTCDEPTKPATAQYTYTFAGWTPEVTQVTGNATYTATYTSTLRKYTVTFLDEDGTVLSSQQWNYGAMPTCDEPSKPATAQHTYSFAGWAPEVTQVTGNATYTATYTSTLRKYTITFLDEDGTVLSAQQWNYGATPTCDEPTKPATAQYTYTFAGWTPEVVKVTGAATYTAIYSSVLNKYRITFEVKGDPTRSYTLENVPYGTLISTLVDQVKEALGGDTFEDEQYIYTYVGLENVEPTDKVRGNTTYYVLYSRTEKSSTGIFNVESTSPARKLYINGVLYIEHNGHLFNAQGARVK